MDVINFSGGGPETEPANDAMIETVRNVAAAGVVPVISAGNDRDDFGLGSAGSPGTAPDAISVAAVSNDHVFAPALDASPRPDAPAALRSVPFQPAGARRPSAWASATRRSSTSGTIVGTDGRPVDPRLCGPAGEPERRARHAPGRLADRARSRSSRAATAPSHSKAARARAAGAIGVVFVDNRPGEANVVPVELALPAGMIADLDGAALRAYLATRGGRARVRIGRDAARARDRPQRRRDELLLRRADRLRAPAQAGRRRARRPDPLLDAARAAAARSRSSTGRAWRRRTSPARRRCSLQRHPGWTPRQIKSALVSTAGPAWADTDRTRRRRCCSPAAASSTSPPRTTPNVFTEPPRSRSGTSNVTPRRRRDARSCSRHGRGRRRRGVDGRGRSRSRSDAGVALDVAPALVRCRRAASAAVPVAVRAAADAAAGDDYGFVVLRRGDVVRRIPYVFLVTRPGLARRARPAAAPVQLGDTRNGRHERARRYRFPARALRPRADYTGAPCSEDGAESST